MAKTQTPGPPMRLFGFLREMRRDPLTFFLNCAATYGDVVQIRYGVAVDLVQRRWGTAGYILNHPTDIKHVLVTNQRNYRKFPFPPAGQRVFGKGLLTSEDPLHLQQRRMMQPFFHQQCISGYAEVMVLKTEERLERWKDGATLNVFQEMTALTLAIVSKTLFNMDIGDEANDFSEAVTIGLHHIHQRQMSFVGFFPIVEYLPTHANRQFRKAVKQLDEAIFGMIHAQRMRREESDDLLSMLLHARDEEGNTMSDQQVRDEVLTLILAGHETTANALAWTWYLLSQHPDVESQLLSELRDVLNGRLPSTANVPKLVYTEMVFAEAMRLYPPVWGLSPRTSLGTDVLPSGSTIAAGDVVYIIPYVVHRNPRLFQDPERFDPERFSPAAKHQRSEYAYFPFGGGSRRCIGEAFAWMEGILILATIAQRFKMTLPTTQTIVPEPLVTLRPKNGVLMQLSKRL